MTHTGMWRVDRSCLSRSRTRQPSMSGRTMSSVMSVGLVLARQRQRRGALRGDQALAALLARGVEQEAARRPGRSRRSAARGRRAGCRRGRRRASLTSSARLGCASASTRVPRRRLQLGGGGPRSAGGSLVGCADSVATERRGRAVRVGERQVEREGAAPARRCSTRRISPPREPRQLAADGQAQAGAAVLAAGAAVGLLEGLEDDLLLVGSRCRCRCR